MADTLASAQRQKRSLLPGIADRGRDGGDVACIVKRLRAQAAACAVARCFRQAHGVREVLQAYWLSFGDPDRIVDDELCCRRLASMGTPRLRPGRTSLVACSKRLPYGYRGVPTEGVPWALGIA